MQGRDANKKLQRAIKAGKLRDKLPAMVQELRGLLAEWKDCEGEVRTGHSDSETEHQPGALWCTCATAPFLCALILT